MTRIALLNIGTELLRGTTVNTNAAFMGRLLIDAGYALTTTHVIHDEGPVIRAAFDALLATHEVVLVTGGLGPTKDDITKKVLLERYGGEFVCHAPTLARIEGFLARLNRPLLPHNRAQADVPSTCTVMENEMGTAPGMAFLRDGRTLVSMPGVPYEMEFIMTRHVIPWLQAHYPVAQQHKRVVRTIGIAESVIAERMERIEDSLDPRINIAYLPSQDGVKIELKAAGDPSEAAAIDAVLLDAQAKVADLLAQYVYALEDKKPDQLLAELLLAHGITIATAESCTGGRIATKLVEHSGVSAVLRGGVVAYMAAVKQDLLGVSEATIATQGIVSEAVAREMAEGARKTLKSDVAISITGIAEAADDAPPAEQPQAWIAVATPQGTVAHHVRLLRNRKVNIEVAAFAALVHGLRAVREMVIF